MARRGEREDSRVNPAIIVFMVLAFVASGAWRISWLPPTPEAQTYQLVTLGALLVVVGLGLVPTASIDRRLRWGIGAVGLAVAIAWLAAGNLLQAAFYDIYSFMPLVQWLAFPAAFVLAAHVAWDLRSMRYAAATVVGLATIMSMVLAYQSGTTDGFSEVFGSTGYSITALSVAVPLAVGLAVTSRDHVRWVWYGAAAVMAVCLGLLSGAVMGALAMVLAGLLSIAIHPIAWRARSPWRRRGMWALAAALLMFVALTIAQVPVLGGGYISPDRLAESESMASRAYIWEGAQRMVAERPVLGFGPSGYRVAAVEFFDPEALSFGPDKPGNADPTVYSPQSPHSVIWEILTRLGIVGGLAFFGLLVAWVLVLRERLDPTDEGFGLRAGLAAGFVCAVFAMLVSPPLFAIGLLAPAAAGFAVAAASSDSTTGRLRLATRIGLVASGVAVAAVAVWLVSGLWVAESVSPDEPLRAMDAHERALEILPGHPTLQRRLLGMRVLYAVDEVAVREAQVDIDSAPEYITGYAPNLVDFAARSMAQAERTGRKDLTWEQAVLDRAAERIPPIPSLVAERLHLALLQSDTQAVRSALPDAERWGGPYPATETFIQQARELLGETP